jgi:hypothetical protein
VTQVKHLVLMLGMGVLAVWSCSQAQAAYVNYQINSGGLETFNITWDSTTENALAGGIQFHRTGGSTTMPADFVTVCTDIGATLYLGATYGYTAPQSFDGQSGIRPTWGAGNQGTLLNEANAAAAIQAAADVFFEHQIVLSTGTTSEKAALQLAVWEALYDTVAGSADYNLGGGRFKINSGDSVAVALAANWLSQININALYTGYLLVPDPTIQYYLPAQEVFYNVTRMTSTPVPETTTLVAGVLLLLPLVGSTVRILRKKRALHLNNSEAK